MTDDHLEKARAELRAYAERSNCGWCKKKAEQLATAAEDLEGAMPDAERLRTAVSKTRALSKLDDVSSEIRTQRERSGRLLSHLEEFGKAAEEERTPPPPAQSLGPPIVTPDDIARRDAELYRRYKEVARRRGPVRDRIAFRLFKRTERQ